MNVFLRENQACRRHTQPLRRDEPGDANVSAYSQVQEIYILIQND